MRSIWIGFDPRQAEVAAFAVARSSIRRRLTQHIPIYAVNMSKLQRDGIYTRPTNVKHGKHHDQLWDVISDAPMSTRFAITRFLVPHLAQTGLALFVDCDVMARVDLCEIFNLADPTKACSVVKHKYTPKHDTKMLGQAQLPYDRKNWSSVVLWNCDHPRTKFLTPEIVNKERGLWLHQFSWLADHEIGELAPEWNHLVGEQAPNPNAKIVHFTQGTPNMQGHEHCEFAKDWWHEC